MASFLSYLLPLWLILITSNSWCLFAEIGLNRNSFSVFLKSFLSSWIDSFLSGLELNVFLLVIPYVLGVRIPLCMVAFYIITLPPIMSEDANTSSRTDSSTFLESIYTLGTSLTSLGRIFMRRVWSGISLTPWLSMSSICLLSPSSSYDEFSFLFTVWWVLSSAVNTYSLNPNYCASCRFTYSIASFGVAARSKLRIIVALISGVSILT